MKKKLLSIFLVLSMLLTSILCLLPTSAEESEDPADQAAREAGYVCRIGEANASFEGYYKFFSAADTNYTDDQPNALAAALGAGKKATITLIDTVNVSQNVSNAQTTKFLHGSVVVGSGKSLTVDGNGHTYHSKWSFRADGGEITVKNCNIALTDGATECFGDVRSNGTLIYENCAFSAASNTNRDSNGYFIAPNLTANATMTMKNCTVNIKDDTSKGGAIFWANNGSYFTLNLDNVKLDASAYGSKAGFVMDGGNLNITGGSDIKVGGNAINAANVTIADSSLETVTASFGNIFNYGSKSFAICVNLINATLTAKKYAFLISDCKAGVNVTLDGNTVINGANRAFSITNNTCPVAVTAKGNAEIRSAAGEDNAIYVCGKDANASFALTLAETAKLISAKNAISFAHGSNPITKATISILDHAVVQAENGYLLEAFNRPVVYNLSDKATVNTKTGIQNGNSVTTNNLYTPIMLPGASVRIVEGSNGIRFTSELKKEANVLRYGTLLVKKADLGTSEFTAEALTAAGITFADIAATEAGTVAGEAVTTYNAALTNLPEDQFVTDFAARAYAIYEFDGVEYTVYSDYSDADNVRNISDVAEAARADTKPAAEGSYRHEVAEGVFSPYTKEQYELLLTFIKKK